MIKPIMIRISMVNKAIDEPMRQKYKKYPYQL
jgi:hypothetical protein